MQGNRTLIIVNNPGLTPANRQELMNELRRAGLKIINVRIASDHIEIDLYINDMTIEKIKSLGFIIRELISINKENEDKVLNEENAAMTYVRLFNEERFWEAHEALERIWHKSKDEGIQGLIILAAAFVKIQENNPEAFRRLIIRARELITSNEIPWINKENLLRKIDSALTTMKSFKIEEQDLRPIQKT
ncbi:MAG: DUF309 domain-containing protein [Vulcanisaeta sp.]|uniref:DUF309 domain-containing protein n=1 Tax=Vulcanisaeta sp. TaxID=2020871 RepID=UPI003D137EFE